MNFPRVLNELRLRDHSVEPPKESAAYPVFVQSTDADGNALGGIRHPLLTAPLATHTGWALRASGYGEGDLFTIQGSMIWFADTGGSGSKSIVLGTWFDEQGWFKVWSLLLPPYRRGLPCYIT